MPQLEPEELGNLGPRDMSFWVASFFSDVKVLQQSVSGVMAKQQSDRNGYQQSLRRGIVACNQASAWIPGSY